MKRRSKEVTALFKLSRKELRELNETMTYKQIGEKLGVSASSVHRAFARRMTIDEIRRMHDDKIYYVNTHKVRTEKPAYSSNEEDYGHFNDWMNSKERIVKRSLDNEVNHVDYIVKQFLN
jgi:hypothetical protein